MNVTLEAATEATDDLVAALNALLPQLSPVLGPVSRAALAEALAQPGLTLLLARDAEGRVIGMATLLVNRTLIGWHARLEDVVVDAASRGLGVGERLTRAAIQQARDQGAADLSLTSNPRREAARRLYGRIGFTPYDTGVFVLDLRS